MANVRRPGILSIALLVAFCAAGPKFACAQGTIRWEASIDSAKRSAAASNRLVLVIFTAPQWCVACRGLESDLNSQPSVGQSIETNYVAVRINADYYPNTAKQYHIKTLPTTIVLAPTAQGEVLDVIPQRIPLDQYLSRLNRVADDSRRRNGAVAQLASANPQRSAAAPITPANPPVVNIPAAQNGISIPVTNPATNQAANDARRPAAPFYPMCLDGFCPVRLAENHVWTPGQKAWGAVHRGRTYLFAGEEERRRFMADPDRYAPVLSGGDIVAQLEQGRALQGSREHGSQYAGHVYLFADESNLARFMANPNFYAERVQEAARTSEQAAASMR